MFILLKMATITQKSALFQGNDIMQDGCMHFKLRDYYCSVAIDGHGSDGHIVKNFIIEILSTLLEESKLDFSQSSESNNIIMQTIFQNMQNNLKYFNGGACITLNIVVMQENSYDLYCWHLGDTTCFLFDKIENKITQVTSSHDGTNIEEAKRIRSLGISLDNITWDKSVNPVYKIVDDNITVIEENEIKQPPGAINGSKAARLGGRYGINLTGSLGDSSYTRLGFRHNPEFHFIKAIPFTTSIFQFSDGVTDILLLPGEVAYCKQPNIKYFQELLNGDEATLADSIKEYASTVEIVDETSKFIWGDDITVVHTYFS
jgi:hypothetical protein